MNAQLLKQKTVDQLTRLPGLSPGIMFLGSVYDEKAVYQVEIRVSCRMRADASALSVAGGSDV